MELRSRSLPPPMERSNRPKSTTPNILEQTNRPTSMNPLEVQPSDNKGATAPSPVQSRLNSPGPFEDPDLRDWTNPREKPGWQSTDFEDHLREYSRNSPFHRFQAERLGQPERGTTFPAIPSRQDPPIYQGNYGQDESYDPVRPKAIKPSTPWEQEDSTEPWVRMVNRESFQPRRFDYNRLRPLPVQDPDLTRPDYPRRIPDRDFYRVPDQRYMRNRPDSPIRREQPDQYFDHRTNNNMLGLQRPSAESTRNQGHDRVYINHDFRPRPPTFDGKPDSWEPFLMQMRLMSQSYGWPDRKFREQLMFALRGEALLFASNLPHVTVENTESLLQAMGQRFGQCLLAETHRANLYNLKKQSKESLQQYSARVSRLMSRAYPGMQGNAVFDNLAIEHLLRGLPDQKLAYEIFTKKPKDLSDAVDMITWHEACRQYTAKSNGVRNVEYSDDDSSVDGPVSDSEFNSLDLRRVNGRKMVTEERVNQLWRDMQKYLSEQLEKLTGGHGEEQRQSDRRYGNTSKAQRRDGPPVCYSCNEEGHISPNCPKKQTEKNPKQGSQENYIGLC